MSNAVVCTLKDIIIHKQEIIGHSGLVRSSAVEEGESPSLIWLSIYVSVTKATIRGRRG